LLRTIRRGLEDFQQESIPAARWGPWHGPAAIEIMKAQTARVLLSNCFAYLEFRVWFGYSQMKNFLTNKPNVDRRFRRLMSFCTRGHGCPTECRFKSCPCYRLISSQLINAKLEMERIECARLDTSQVPDSRLHAQFDNFRARSNAIECMRRSWSHMELTTDSRQT